MNYKDLPGINNSIRILKEQVANWENSIKRIRRFQPDGELAVEYSRLQYETESRIQALQAQRDEIIGQMSMDERTKAVLLLHYDTGMTWKQVAEHEGVSLRTVYRIAGEK